MRAARAIARSAAGAGQRCLPAGDVASAHLPACRSQRCLWSRAVGESLVPLAAQNCTPARLAATRPAFSIQRGLADRTQPPASTDEDVRDVNAGPDHIRQHLAEVSRARNTAAPHGSRSPSLQIVMRSSSPAQSSRRPPQLAPTHPFPPHPAQAGQ